MLKALQQQLIDSIPHETVGFQDIVANCTSWPVGTELGSVLYFQSVTCDVVSGFGAQGRPQLEPLDIPDALGPVEPPRLNIWPELDGIHSLELLIPVGVCDGSRAEALFGALEDYIRTVN